MKSNKRMVEVNQNMSMFKTFQCIINFHMILYFGADICKCMNASQMKTNDDGKTTSVHSTVVVKDIEFENKKFYGENSTPNKWYKVQVISEKLVDESISNQHHYNYREKKISDVAGILNPQDDSSENHMTGIPKSLCHLCKVQANVGGYIKSSNLSKYYEGTTRNQFQCSSV